MNKIENSKIVLILSVLLMFLVIGAATAADDKLVNETVSTSSDVDTLSQEVDSVDEGVSTTDNTIIGSRDTSNEILSKNKVSSFSDLNMIIKSADENTTTINLDSDFEFSTGDSKNGILISRNIIIDGHNCNIDAKGNTLFKITSNNITLKNINIINASSAIDLSCKECELNNISFKDCIGGITSKYDNTKLLFCYI